MDSGTTLNVASLSVAAPACATQPGVVVPVWRGMLTLPTRPLSRRAPMCSTMVALRSRVMKSPASKSVETMAPPAPVVRLDRSRCEAMRRSPIISRPSTTRTPGSGWRITSNGRKLPPLDERTPALS